MIERGDIGAAVINVMCLGCEHVSSEDKRSSLDILNTVRPAFKNQSFSADTGSYLKSVVVTSGCRVSSNLENLENMEMSL